MQFGIIMRQIPFSADLLKLLIQLLTAGMSHLHFTVRFLSCVFADLQNMRLFDLCVWVSSCSHFIYSYK